MIMRWFCYLLILVMPGSVLALSSIRESGALQIKFSNLNTAVSVRQNGSGYVLNQTHHSIPVQLTNRLLVRARSDVSANDLKKVGVNLIHVQQLAKLKQSALWLVTIADIHDLQKTMEKLRQDTPIAYAQPDLLQTRQPAQQQVIDANEQSLVTHSTGEQKARVRLAIIDDGFNFHHPEFANINLVLEYDADQRVQSASPKSGLDQHGTLVAGVIVAAADEKGIDGLAPDVELIAIRQVSSWTSDMVLAFSVARMMKADVVNSSWVLPFLPEPLFDLLADWMQEQQPYLVFAAGNNQRDACDVNALSELKGIWLIGAANQKGQPLPYSNYGSCVSFYAPAQFMSTAAQGAYKPFTGTSAATAYVSGLIARELASGKKPNMAFIETIPFNCKQLSSMPIAKSANN